MQSQSSVLKRLYEREKQLAGKVKWKSRLLHYLLTIHYWIRYTRFRIPIAESFLRRATVSIRIVSTNKHANIRPAQRPALVIRMCTYTNPRNKPDAEGKSGPCWYVCLENKNASFETCILNSTRFPSSRYRSPYPSHVQSTLCLSVVTASCYWQSTFLRVVLAYFSSRIRNVPCLWFFRFFLCIFGSAIFQQQSQQCS